MFLCLAVGRKSSRSYCGGHREGTAPGRAVPFVESMIVSEGEWASCKTPPLEGADRPGAHQGGDSRWALTQPSVDPVSARLMTAPPVSIAERGTAPTDRPSGSRGQDPGDVHSATDSAPRRCPEHEGRNPSPTESARRRCPEVRVPRDEVSQNERGHSEDISYCTVTDGLVSYAAG